MPSELRGELRSAKTALASKAKKGDPQAKKDLKELKEARKTRRTLDTRQCSPAVALILQLEARAAAWRAEHVWKPNQLRHTAGTEVRARFGLEASQIVLGHAHASTTEIYAERDLAKAKAAILEVG